MALLLAGCPEPPGPGGDTEAATEGTSGPGGDCEPGQEVTCACTDGSMGTQTCNAEGTAFGSCECAPAEDTSGGPGSTGAATSAADSTGPAEGGSTSGDSTEGSTGEGCVPGTAQPCEGCAEGPGVQRCNDQGELGPCECCEGLHPLVEGELRYCERGYCYCGNLQLEPPVDVCYEQPIAEACCPGDIVLECY